MKLRWWPISLLLILLLVFLYFIFFNQTPPTSSVPKPVSSGTTYSSHPHVAIYFSKNFGSEVQTRAVLRSYNTQHERLTVAMTELLKGPTTTEKQLGYFTEIPKSTRLLGVEIKPHQININVSQEFASGGGTGSMTQRLNELMQTVLSIEHTRPVYLLLEGRPVTTLGGEGLEVPQPLQLPQ